MSKRLLLGMVLVLLITNIATVTFIIKGNSNQDVSEEEHPAIVGTEPITAAKLNTVLHDQYGQKVLEDLINEIVVMELAEQNNLSLNEKWVQREVSVIETASTLLNSTERIEQRNIWDDKVRYQHYLEDLLTRDVVVSDREIEQYYNENRGRLTFPRTYQLSHIEVKDYATANEVITDLEEGASFPSLAAEYSIDDNTNDQGGYLGYLADGNLYLPEQYYDIASSLESDTYSEPFQTGNRYAILYLHTTLPEISFSLNEVRGEIRRRIAKNKMGNNPMSPRVLWDEVGVEWNYND
ncbi:peptidylprolyl isomerase [Salirhabdus salicampi]|uniref:peptidylprolyl isomerase n=1 Tax=Salirhabdus salicampi TaxID=476102 RepID=UPI0020C3E68C|nr:peptidyl-prolyl cis-trans isomerase [Salirhabdus salicampi]MCP8618193.1 peptidyl-prolyl cis-trans isomerase [Salirhabdus salicampi]